MTSLTQKLRSLKIPKIATQGEGIAFKLAIEECIETIEQHFADPGMVEAVAKIICDEYMIKRQDNAHIQKAQSVAKASISAMIGEIAVGEKDGEIK